MNKLEKGHKEFFDWIDTNKPGWSIGGPLYDVAIEAFEAGFKACTEKCSRPIDKSRPIFSRALRALCLTQDYVGKEKLPPIDGWEWYEAGKIISELIPGDEWAKQFKIRTTDLEV